MSGGEATTFVLVPSLVQRAQHLCSQSKLPGHAARHHACPLHRASATRRHFAAQPHPRTATAMSSSEGVSATPGGDGEADGGDGGDEQVNVEEEISLEERIKLDNMRLRLQGLFGNDDDAAASRGGEAFNGEALRQALVDRWGVQYDVQPQRRHGRVYMQIMWRFFEQQSFYMNEDEYASHCEAVAILLKRWKMVDYFLDFISTIKKRPVVGIAVNIPMPGLDGNTEAFDV